MDESNPGNSLKEVLRTYPTGVTVVTSLLDGEPAGGTMNSFTSVSLNPPLVALFISIDGRTSKAIDQTGSFVINILKEDQEEEAQVFANDKINDRFSRTQFHLNGDGIPVLDGSLAFIECKLYKKEKIADHYLFVGEVKNASILNDEHALVYHRRGFKSTLGLTT